MAELTIESIPPGADVNIDGKYIGPTPITFPIDEEEEPIDMAIFVSPQYRDDAGILSAMRAYTDAVKEDIGWNVSIEKIDRSNNRYDYIQDKINELYNNNPLKACMMVGEDTAEEKNVFHTSIDRKCQQALPFWQSHGAGLSPICSSKATAQANIIRVPTSLLYPNFNDPYNTKRAQIIKAMNKFSVNRQRSYTNSVLAFYDGAFYDTDEFGDIFRDKLPIIGDTTQIGDPEQNIVDDCVSGEYKLVIAAGHARPDIIYVGRSAFTCSKHGKNVNTPLLVLHGCTTDGWYTEIDDDCLYQPPSNRLDWFGHGIFDNGSIRVIIAGFPIGRYGKDIEFVGSWGIQKMSTGKTIAEAMIGIVSQGSDCTLFGDPTFHY